MTKKKSKSKSKGSARLPTGGPVESKSSSQRSYDRLSQAPVSFGRSMRLGRPQFSGGGQNIRVKHRELICDVAGSALFAMRAELSINPGLDLVFPWLSRLAGNFETYRFHTLRFLYLPTCATSRSGMVCLAVDYDAADAAPISKFDMSAYSNYARASCWQEVVLDCPYADMNKFPQRYLRQKLVSGTDIKTYDVGKLYVAASLCPDNNPNGELYVEYDVELMTPQLHAPSDGLDAVSIAAVTNVARATPFGTAPTVTGTAEDFTIGTTGITFNTVGEFLLDYLVAGTGLNATAPNVLGSAGTKAISALANAAGTFQSGAWQANVTAPGQTMTFDFTPSATTLSSSNFKLAPFPFSL